MSLNIIFQPQYIVVSGLFIIEIVRPCQNDRFRYYHLNYIYLISYKNAKRQTHKMDLPLLKNDIIKNLKALIFTFFAVFAMTTNRRSIHYSEAGLWLGDAVSKQRWIRLFLYRQHVDCLDHQFNFVSRCKLEVLD